MIPKRYLGDSVYVELEDGMFKLTTENGIVVDNAIFLEPAVLEALNRFKADVYAANEQAQLDKP